MQYYTCGEVYANTAREKKSTGVLLHLILFRIRLFGAAHGCGRQVPLRKFFHTYPTIMKLGTFIPYLKKIQKLNKSHDTLLDFS